MKFADYKKLNKNYYSPKVSLTNLLVAANPADPFFVGKTTSISKYSSLNNCSIIAVFQSEAMDLPK